MPVKVLIIDDVATNRIVLKVKLAAASYEVHQACSGEEGVKIAEREKPDIYVVNADLEGESSVDVIKRLAALSIGQQANTIALSEKDCAENRLDLLRAGAFDVLTKPLCESLFLARMRSLSRGLHDRKDLALTTDTADALGFDEPTRPFTVRGRICALNAQTPQHRVSLQSLVANCTHDVEFCEPGSGSHKEAPRNIGTPDVVLVPIDGDEDQAGLTHLAELRLTDPTRHARLIAVLSDTNTALAGRALDLGADDVVGFQANTVEAEIRISRQLHGKRAEDSHRQRLQNSLEAAVTDPLTGLYNRRYALSALGKMADSLMRQGGCFAVMVADLDRFKTVNDTYGHNAGDIALKRVAEKLHTSLTQKDIISRFGGEEFLILLPDTDDQSAREVADHLRLMVRETDIFVPGQCDPIHVTISIGVTLAQGTGNGAQPSIEALLGQADQALYASKSDGRDTVSFRHSSAA